MKRFILVTLLVFNYAFAKAQDNAPNPVEAPRIGVKLMYGAMADFGETQIKFKKVLTDSRCPQEVTCVWAGEATVLVEVYKNGKLEGEQTLKFAPINPILDIVNTNLLNIRALKLQPYPKSNIAKNKEDYYLVLDMKEN